MTISSHREWKEGELESPDASWGDKDGALHWYRDAEAIRVVNPETGIDVVIPEQLFSQFISKLDEEYPELTSIRDAAFEDGRQECESEHPEEEED